MVHDVFGWMRRTPHSVVILACGIAACLLIVGAVAHLTDLFRHGLRPYDWAPSWLNFYWSSLAVLDPFVAVLLLRGKRRGADLACVIVTTDIAANWYAVYGIQHSDFLAQSGLQRLTAFTLLVLGAAPFLRRYLTN